MNQNDRWWRIEELCQSALDCDAGDRAAFLAAVCGSDIALLREVEALLARADAAENFLAEPAGHLAARAWAQDAPSMIGQQIAHYRIVERLGAGGMGVVYRAEDMRLKRSIALKFLPPDLTDDEHARRRFTVEARVLASFTHPHIAAIYGVEEFNGQNVLVLELIEGQTLADRIAARPIPLEDALPIAKQIAEALEAAHEKGIVHRDLKPSNIALTKEGTVKVLDFGVARATPTSGVGPDLMSARMQTLPALSTGTGVIVGTVAYMSPEQARGQVVDKRTDLWAFGCVLYEMLTGHVAFVGNDSTELLAAIVRDDLDWGALPPNTPQSVRRLLRRCLEKDRQRRLADAADARLDIEEAIAAPGLDSAVAGPTVPAPTRSIWRRWFPLPAAALAGAAVAGVAAWGLMRNGSVYPATVTRFAINLPREVRLPPNAGLPMAISRDGRRLVYNVGGWGNVQLYSQSLDQLAGVPLPGVADGGSVFLSPDGEWVGYHDVREGLFKKVRLAGGEPATICAAPAAGGSGAFRGATWGPNGTIVFSAAGYAGLMQVSDAGGVPQPLTKPVEGEIHQHPSFLPGGRALLFVISRSGTHTVAVLPLDTRKPRALAAGIGPRFAASGHVVFLRNGGLWAMKFDPVRLEARGDAVPVLKGATRFDVADNGTLVYTPAGVLFPRTLVWVDRQGREEPIKAPPRNYRDPRLSPDGTRIAVEVRDREDDVWIWQTTHETLTRLTFGLGLDPLNGNPIWSGDGTRILFASHRSGEANLFWQFADGTGQAERLTESPNMQFPTGVSLDGTAVIFTEITPQGGGDVLLLPVASGQFEVYVRPFPDVSGGQWQVSTGGGASPVWAHSGRE